MKAVIESYRYHGPHRTYDPRRDRMVDGHSHWDWRYKIITAKGLTVYYRQGFCSWGRACASLQRNWPSVLARLTDEVTA